MTDRDGNVFAIIARCKAAANLAGWPKARVDAVVASMFDAGSYDAVLRIVLENFNVR